MSEEVSSGAVSPATGTKESATRGVAPSPASAHRASSSGASPSASPGTSPKISTHPSEELLEQYCFGRLTDPDLALMEEHLLLCPACCARVGDMDDYLAAMKAGLAEAVASESTFDAPASPEPIEPIPMPVTPVMGRTRQSRTVISGFLKIAAVVVFTFSATVAWNTANKVDSVAETAVPLVAMRGGEQALSTVPAGRPVRLEIDPSSLPAAQEYRAQIVDASGRDVWNGAAPFVAQNLSFHVAKRLSAGDYWVRLYSAGPAEGQLLREFALTVR